MSKARRVVLALFALLMPGIALASDALPDVRFEEESRIIAYEGKTFGDYGPFERIRGIAHLRIDPLAPENAGIVDLKLAPRDADGLVAYDVDVVILRPAAASKARRVLLYDVLNRGMKLLAMFSGGSPMTRDDPIDPGDGLLLEQGYTLVWSGWQGDIATPGLMGARFPVASDHGKPITGTVATEAIFDDLTTNTMTLPYPSASIEQRGASLSVRALSSDEPVALPATAWRFTDDRHITIDRPDGFDAGAIYSFTYSARDPVVMGLGFAATRDLVSWLRHAPTARGNPLADIARAPCERDAAGRCVNAEGGIYASAVAFGGSQSGRYLRDFVWQGFNRDIAGRRVFDGVVPFIPGARQTFTNFRFAEPGRFSRQHEDHAVPGFTFPYTYATLTDPVTGRTDGILARCTASRTCPKLFHIDTSGEFWQAGASLVGTGGTGHDVAFPDTVRAYMIAGGAHAPGMAPPMCRLPANPLNYTPVVRALLLAMVDWTTNGKAPPPSRWPSLDKGELVPVATLAGPAIPSLGLVWPKVLNAPIPPPGKPGWPIHVPAIDADGNDLPGIRMPGIAVPTGTYLGWNLRKSGFAEGDLCLIFGSYLPFAPDAASRGDDPRASLAERYASPDARERMAAKVAGDLAAQGYLRQADADDLPADAAAGRP